MMYSYIICFVFCFIIKAVCDMYKRVLKTLMDDFAPMLQDVSRMISEMYHACPHASLLDLVRQVCTAIVLSYSHQDKALFLYKHSPFLKFENVIKYWVH